MTDTPIPEDVMKAARQVCEQLRLPLNLDYHPFIPSEQFSTIARAIQAERERCAKVAEIIAEKGWDGQLAPGNRISIAAATGHRIAAAIRKGDNNG